MTTWQLESTGRYPQALKDHLARWHPGGREPTQREAYLEAWDWLDKNGFQYHNVGHSRCTGQFGFVDCSGGIVLCRNAAADRVGAGRLGRETDESSYSYARLCHNLPRPQWMIDEFGPGRGYQVTPEQANVTPAVWKIIGRDEGQDYGDRRGHIESKAWPANMAVGAFSHASGVGYRVPFVTTHRPAYYAIPPYLDGFVVVTPSPPLAPEIKEHDMIVLPGVARPESRGYRSAAIAPNGQAVFLMNGGKVLGMNDVNPDDPKERRRWYPKNADGSAAATPDLPLIGLVKDSRYLIALRLDGGMYRGEIDAS